MRVAFVFWRIIVGVMLLIAATGKTISPGQTLSVLTWDGVPVALANPMIGALIAIEIAVAASLLLFRSSWPVMVSLALFVVFSLQLAFLLMHRDAPPCGCLGLFSQYVQSNMGSSASGLMRNLSVIASGVLLMLLQRPRSDNGLELAPA